MKRGLTHKGNAIMWVKFVVGWSLHCSKRFLLGILVLPPPQNQHFQPRFQFSAMVDEESPREVTTTQY